MKRTAAYRAARMKQTTHTINDKQTTRNTNKSTNGAQ